MSPQPSVRPERTRRSWVRPGLGLAVLAGALVFTLAACGGGGAPSPSGGAPASGAGGAGRQAPPGAFGTIAAVAASSIEVRNQQTGQVTVNYTSSTTFTDDVSGTLADVTPGSCVQVVGSSSGTGQPVAARTVTISPAPAAGSGCALPGRAGAGGGRPSGAPNPSRAARPSGANGPGGNFGGAFGSVTAVTATGFTVHGQARATGAATDTTVTVSSSTTYTKSESATAGALTVGACAAAQGTTDDTGAVTARTITVSKPVNGACTSGFGGGRRGGGYGGGAPGGGNG